MTIDDRPERSLFDGDDDGIDREPPRDVDVPVVDELRRIYFRHREALAEGTPRPLDERETDRQRVNDLYPALRMGPDRMLDAHTLGTLVDSQSATQRAALMSLVSPDERLRMLAVMVRRNSFPVVLLSRPSTLQLSPLLARRTERPSLDADSLAARAPEVTDNAPLPSGAADAVAVREIDPEVIAAGTEAIMARLQRGLTAAEVAALSDQDAQYLSILGSNPGSRLVSLPDGGLRIDVVDGDASTPPAHRPRSFVLNFRTAP